MLDESGEIHLAPVLLFELEGKPLLHELYYSLEHQRNLYELLFEQKGKPSLYESLRFRAPEEFPEISLEEI